MNHDSVWHALVAHVKSLNGYIGSIEYKDAPGAGRGLFLTQDIQPCTRLVSIPRQALINTKSLRVGGAASTSPNKKGPKSYSKLNSTQALSLHLCLTQQRNDAVSDTYTASLPRSFDEHPLVWLERDSSPSSTGAKLFESLPISAKKVIREVQKRFLDDWEVVQTSLAADSRGGTTPIDSHDFLWGWLCVNTRCIHYSLNSADSTRSIKDIDLTLCPIIDFANHTIDEVGSSQVTRNDDGSLDLTSPNTDLRQGQEIFLRYSSHSNAVLLAEYGFAIPRSKKPSKVSEGDDDAVDGGEINVDDLIKALLEHKDGLWRKEMLESRGYWGFDDQDPDHVAHSDWTLHSAPAPAHPSYRILPALRLLHLSQPTPEEATLGPWTDAAAGIASWEAMVIGGQEMVSSENELAVRGTLREVCEQVMHRSQSGLEELDRLRNSLLVGPLASVGWAARAISCIGVLWKEEQEVASALLETIDCGDPLY
ncbi:hypothetical protein FRB96_009262 [Tulasnella sp. 330]|nr:hypothetical protein FRB96_009262 [Tulasnella sp. 330]KAG8883498.1 hypothetical protein FRB97_006481 [Tulasnella sp. 331]KAG8889436.1 hypothetical protein FRB98_004332 [Tulasnella sp. 332]